MICLYSKVLFSCLALSWFGDEKGEQKIKSNESEYNWEQDELYLKKESLILNSNLQFPSLIYDRVYGEFYVYITCVCGNFWGETGERGGNCGKEGDEKKIHSSCLDLQFVNDS